MKQYKNMKTKMKRQGSTELPRFAVGALAIAGASAANGTVVQISFTGSYYSSTSGGGTLDVDFGNDGIADLFGASTGISSRPGNSGVNGVAVFLSNRNRTVELARAGGYVTGVGLMLGGYVQVGAISVSNSASLVSDMEVSIRNLVPVSFTDTNIRSGALTTGYLDVIASAAQPGDKRVTVLRLIFDGDTGGALNGLDFGDSAYPTYVASAVPEPSSLGLLALGAGGLLARRRRSQAA